MRADKHSEINKTWLITDKERMVKTSTEMKFL